MEGLFNTFVVLFIVIDPVGLAPIFAALTAGMMPAARRRTALRGTALATVILLAFLFSGDALFQVLGISLEAFRIAGGALLFLLAIDMVFARQSGLRSTTEGEQREAAHKQDLSVFPLAFPLIAGPGALTTVLLMAANAGDAWAFASGLAVLLVVLGLALASLLVAARLQGWLGETGANVISRLLGLILAALAVQYMLDGLKAVFVAG
ncbi:MAG TPA: MarC family protein [Gammaproteobacteria bacterium]|nr:MarC family protein [Gammaproteobacteria bacterium]